MKLISKIAFDKMTRMGKRVAICRDVIARIKAEKINPCTSYLVYNLRDFCFGNLKDNLNKKTCQCCAKGALLTSFIGNFNKYKRLSIFDADLSIIEENYPSELLEIFGRTLLDAIEVAFEGIKNMHWTTPALDAGIRQVIVKEFAGPFTDIYISERLTTIMKNIIRNRGKLVAGNVVIK